MSHARLLHWTCHTLFAQEVGIFCSPSTLEGYFVITYGPSPLRRINLLHIQDSTFHMLEHTLMRHSIYGFVVHTIPTNKAFTTK
mgnify:CR=1 FL=1